MSTQALNLVDNSNAPAFMAFTSDDAARVILGEAAERAGHSMASVVAGDAGVAARSLADIPTPDVLLVDLDGSISVREAVEGLQAVCDPGTHVVLIGSKNDVGLYRDLMAAGVADYLVKPVSVEQMLSAMEKPAEPSPAEPARETIDEGFSVGVIGARGGVGATSIAIALAWLLAENYELSTSLVDLDVAFGSVALALDIEPGRGLAEAMENPARVDDLFMERAAFLVTERLGVLASEADLATHRISPDAPEKLLESLKHSFRATVLDIPRNLSSRAGLLSSLDHIVLVGEPTLAGLRDLVRLNALAMDAGLAENAIHVVINRTGLLAKGELDEKTITAQNRIRISQTLTFDAKLAAVAMAQAKPLGIAQPKHKISKALMALCAQITPGREPEKKSGLARLFQRAQ